MSFRSGTFGFATFATFATFALAACSGDHNRIPRDGASEPRREPPEATNDDPVATLDARGRTPNSGDVIIVVSWPEPSAMALTSPGRNACGAASRPAVEMFIRDKRETVTALRRAIIELVSTSDPPGDASSGGRASPERTAPVEIAVRDCQIHPVIARLPQLGSAVALINDDERRHEILIEHLGDGTGPPELVARVPLSLVGQRYELALQRAGIVRLGTASDEREHAYVAVPAHPYVAIPDATGAARFEQVPAGRYDVKVWHPPLQRGGPPFTATASVTVEAHKSVERVITIEP